MARATHFRDFVCRILDRESRLSRDAQRLDVAHEADGVGFRVAVGSGRVLPLIYLPFLR